MEEVEPWLFAEKFIPVFYENMGRYPTLAELDDAEFGYEQYLRDLGEPLLDEIGKAFYRYNDRDEVFDVTRVAPEDVEEYSQILGEGDEQCTDSLSVSERCRRLIAMEGLDRSARVFLRLISGKAQLSTLEEGLLAFVEDYYLGRDEE